MKQDSSDAPESLGTVLSDAVETLYRLRLERAIEDELVAGTVGDGFARAYLERDRFKQRFLRALLSSLDAAK